METFTIDFSMPNFVTIGVAAAFWFLLIVGGWSIYQAMAKPATLS